MTKKGISCSIIRHLLTVSSVLCHKSEFTQCWHANCNFRDENDVLEQLIRKVKLKKIQLWERLLEST